VVRSVRQHPGAQAQVATAGTKLLPGPEDGLDVHSTMMPPSSPDAVRHDAPATGGQPIAYAATTLYGPDVSSWQHDGGAIDWAAVADSGQSFTLVKATESGYKNPWLGRDLAGAHAAGLVVGAYAYARPQYDAVAQAEAFATSIAGMPAPNLPPVLDLEETGGLSPGALIGWTHAFLDRLERLTGRVPGIHSSPGFWSSAMANNTAFARYPLWEAHLISAGAPARMGGWSTYWLWQFTHNAFIPGIGGGVDQSRFRGSREELGGAPAPSAIAAHYAELGGPNGVLGA
jgi:lysozyme